MKDRIFCNDFLMMRIDHDVISIANLANMLIGNASDISKEKFDDFFKEFQITKQNQA